MPISTWSASALFRTRCLKNCGSKFDRPTCDIDNIVPQVTDCAHDKNDNCNLAIRREKARRATGGRSKTKLRKKCCRSRVLEVLIQSCL